MSGPVEAASALPYSPQKDLFLVVKRSGSRQEHPGKWEFPGGIVEGEEEPRRAALRELEEETALTGQVLRSGDAGITDTGEKRYLVHPFLVKLDPGEPELSEEHTEYRWVKPGDIGELDHIEGLFSEMNAVDIISGATDVVAAVPVAGDEVLVLKRSEKMRTNTGLWEFVSGRIEEGEDPRDAALRELEEETGLEGEYMRAGGSFEVEADGERFRVHPVLLEVERRNPELTFEHIEHRWLKPAEALGLETVPAFQNDLERLGLL